MIESNKDRVLLAVEKALRCGVSFYCYRLPGGENLHFGVQTEEIATRKGFYVHPFSEGDAKSHFISQNLGVEEFLGSDYNDQSCQTETEIQESISKTDYLCRAEQCVSDLRAGTLSKVVLSRTIKGQFAGDSWSEVYKSLLNAYRDAFVFVYSSEVTGTWLGATPERFLSNRKGVVSTMALAGTRLAGTQGDWGAKEVEEQRFVADYIGGCFDKVGLKYSKSETYTRNAGNVEHLCNDFVGNVESQTQIDSLRAMMHPTPAIAGTPTDIAVSYINNIESHNRRYYGGYVGPVDENGEFDFFVNLRSLEFSGNDYCIYVGGGLTADSDAEKEWQETAEKAKTLQRFL